PNRQAAGQEGGRSLFHLRIGAADASRTRPLTRSEKRLSETQPSAGVHLRRGGGRGGDDLRWLVGPADHQSTYQERGQVVHRIQTAGVRGTGTSSVEDAPGGASGLPQVAAARGGVAVLAVPGVAGLPVAGTHLPTEHTGGGPEGGTADDGRATAPGVR